MAESAPIAHLLAAAWPELKARWGRKIVVKLGGSTIDNPDHLTDIIRDICLLSCLGQQIVVVHGGGKAIDRELTAAGIVPVKVGGRRVTDLATLRVVVDVLLQEINAGVVRRLIIEGLRANAMHSGDQQVLYGTRLPRTEIDLGLVGQVDRVMVDRIEECQKSAVPVVPSLVQEDDGSWLNVNADDAATAIAVAWQVRTLVFLTDTPGILRDVRDPSSRIPRITRLEVDGYVRSGVIAGGMVPKVQGCVAAIEQGVGSVLILDGRVKHALLMEFTDDRIEGTEIAV